MTARTFKIFRYDPSKNAEPYYKRYTLEIQPSWTVLDCLNEIRARHDSTLVFRRSCRGGICGSCAMNINKKNRLACETLVRTLKKKVITVEPLPHFEIIKDLVTDFSGFFESIEKVKPFRGDRTEGRELLQTPRDRKHLDGLYECILCGACTSSCPSFWYDETYPGPAALLKTYRFVADSRDRAAAERLKTIDRDDGVWRCHTIFNCTEACPKGLNPTNAIQGLKHRIFGMPSTGLSGPDNEGNP